MVSCINCNIALSNQCYEYYVTSMGPEIFAIIEEWTSREISDMDRLCQECVSILLIEMRNRSEGNDSARQLGHLSVCICCGISITKRSGRRSRPLTDNCPERAFIANTIHPREIPTNARVCNACWQRAHNHVREMVIVPPSDDQETGTQSGESVSGGSNFTIEPESIQIDRDMQSTCIELYGYRRTPDTTATATVLSQIA